MIKMEGHLQKLHVESLYLNPSFTKPMIAELASSQELTEPRNIS